jgi:hypothetical protein
MVLPSLRFLDELAVNQNVTVFKAPLVFGDNPQFAVLKSVVCLYEGESLAKLLFNHFPVIHRVFSLSAGPFAPLQSYVTSEPTEHQGTDNGVKALQRNKKRLATSPL